MIDILCVTTKLCIGGVQTFLINNVLPLIEQGIRLNFVVQTTESQLYDDYVESLGCKIFRVTPLEVSKLRFMRDIRRIIKSNPNIKIIHSHQNFANTYSLLAAHSLPVRISHAHSCYAPSSLANRMIKSLFKVMLPIVATDYWGCSDKAVKWLYGHHEKSPKCRIIRNAVNVRRFQFSAVSRKNIRNSLGIPEQSVVWCHVGTFGEAKNHTFLLEVFKSFLGDNPDARLILCGDGVLRTSIEKQILTHGISNHVYIVGNVSNSEEYLSAADLFVFPSLFEGFPLSIIEAQASGIPCVTSAAVPEECIFNPNVRRITDYDISDYLVAVKEVLAMTFPREWGGEMIKQKGYDVESGAAEIAKLYKTAIAKSL